MNESKMFMYALYDTQLKRWNMPFWARNDQEAAIILIRSGIPKSIYNDVLLFRLAKFDDELDFESQPLRVMENEEGHSVCVAVKLPPFPEGGQNG